MDMVMVEVDAQRRLKGQHMLFLFLVLCLQLVSSSFAPAQATQAPPAGSAQATQATPAGSGSPAAKIGLFVYPQKNQSQEQQANDESTCYASAQQQTGIDPSAAPP